MKSCRRAAQGRRGNAHIQIITDSTKMAWLMTKIEKQKMSCRNLAAPKRICFTVSKAK